MNYVIIKKNFLEEGKFMCKKFLFCIVLSFIIFSVTSCGKTEEIANNQNVEVSLIPENTYLPEPSESNRTKEKKVEKIMLYLPDENAEYLLPTIVEGEKTPEGLVHALVEQGALPKGTEINYFILKDNGEYISLEDEAASKSKQLAAEIDLSDYFMEEIQHAGTAGESMLMGCVVNTMIDNFNLQSIMVSANDEVIMTGHCIYDEPQTFYQGLVEK